MKVEKFWNRAFLAALERLPAKRAKAEADAAVELALAHWYSHVGDQVRVFKKFSSLPIQQAALIPKAGSKAAAE